MGPEEEILRKGLIANLIAEEYKAKGALLRTLHDTRHFKVSISI